MHVTILVQVAVWFVDASTRLLVDVGAKYYGVLALDVLQCFRAVAL
eukprot:SAG31_NODE_21571_length_546_cov_0.807606_1_plen_45_part_10